MLANGRILETMSVIAFDRDKFRELIVYVAHQTKDDPTFGDTHLNKVLYWTDFDGYSAYGRPVTGAKYFKLQFGPAAKPLMPVRHEMVEDGELTVIDPPRGSKKARKTVPLRPPDTSRFSQEELELVDELIHRLQGLTAKAVSDLSHKEAGWRLVELYDDIPYRMSLLSDERPSEETIAQGRLKAARLGW